MQENPNRVGEFLVFDVEGDRFDTDDVQLDFRSVKLALKNLT